MSYIKRKIVRSTRVQIKLLTNYMVSHPLFAQGEYSGPDGLQNYQTEWEDLRNKLNDLGPKKSLEQWRITWRDLKRRYREESSLRPDDMSEQSKKLLCVINKAPCPVEEVEIQAWEELQQDVKNECILSDLNSDLDPCAPGPEVPNNNVVPAQPELIIYKLNSVSWVKIDNADEESAQKHKDSESSQPNNGSTASLQHDISKTTRTVDIPLKLLTQNGSTESQPSNDFVTSCDISETSQPPNDAVNSTTSHSNNICTAGKRMRNGLNNTRRKRKQSGSLSYFNRRMIDLKMKKIELLDRKNVIANEKNTALNRIADALQELSKKFDHR